MHVQVDPTRRRGHTPDNPWADDLVFPKGIAGSCAPSPLPFKIEFTDIAPQAVHASSWFLFFLMVYQGSVMDRGKTFLKNNL
jgi:hypothetical protein